MSAGFTSARFIGRERELVRIADALEAAADGRASTLLIAGSGGLGVGRPSTRPSGGSGCYPNRSSSLVAARVRDAAATPSGRSSGAWIGSSPDSPTLISPVWRGPGPRSSPGSCPRSANGSPAWGSCRRDRRSPNPSDARPGCSNRSSGWSRGWPSGPRSCSSSRISSGRTRHPGPGHLPRPGVTTGSDPGPRDLPTRRSHPEPSPPVGAGGDGRGSSATRHHHPRTVRSRRASRVHRGHRGRAAVGVGPAARRRAFARECPPRRGAPGRPPRAGGRIADGLARRAGDGPPGSPHAGMPADSCACSPRPASRFGWTSWPRPRRRSSGWPTDLRPGRAARPAGAAACWVRTSRWAWSRPWSTGS